VLDEGQKAPDFELADLEGAKWSLHSALQNGPVVLAFFKISCPTCQFTFPYLQKLLDGARPGAPQLVAISQDDAAGTSQFHKRFGISMRTLVDKTKSFPVSNAFRISSVPSLFMIEPDGRISLAVDGFSRSHIEKLGERFGASAFGRCERVPAMRPG
jgi:peroxiredoxin